MYEEKHQMTQTSQNISVYNALYKHREEQSNQSEPPELMVLRKEAMNAFTELGFPTTRMEEWRYTNLDSIAHTHFTPSIPLNIDSLQKYPGSDQRCRLVFVNGRYQPDLSNFDAIPSKLQIMSLQQAILTRQPALMEYFDKFQSQNKNALALLNTALMEDGVYLNIPSGMIVEEPVYLIFLSMPAQKPEAHHPRILLFAGNNSQASIVETYDYLQDEVYWNNTVSDFILGDNASLDHYKIQRESTNAYHTSQLNIIAARDVRLNTSTITLGGKLIRNDLSVELRGEGAECTLNGLYIVSGTSHVDNHTSIDHEVPHCISHELYKGIIQDKAHGVFSGKVTVMEDAQKTDAKQTNQNLLLSEDASVNTKPQLEIYADDVRCTHGATVGQLDENAIFYLRSRGIPLSEAKNLLTYAFASEVLGRIRQVNLKEYLEKRIFSILNESEKS
jgi:Fe-S cluster assembly protein SufD